MKTLWQLLIKKEKYWESKESIIIMNSHRSYTEKSNLIEDSKKIDIDEVIKHNEIMDKSLKSQI